MADRESTTGPTPTTEAGTKRTRPWLRRVGVVVGCLLAGAIINVLVAWVCAIAFQTSQINSKVPALVPRAIWDEQHPNRLGELTLNDFDSILYTRKVGFGCVQLIATPEFRRRRYTHELPVTRVTPELPKWCAMFGQPSEIVEEIAAGWPALSTHTWVDRTGPIVNPNYADWNSPQPPIPVRVGGFEYSNDRVFPWIPLWPGFLINTLFYSAIVWALFAAPRALCRRRRVKRRRCPDCGYDLRGADHGKCPECGEAVKAGNVKTSKRQNLIADL